MVEFEGGLPLEFDLDDQIQQQRQQIDRRKVVLAGGIISISSVIVLTVILLCVFLLVIKPRSESLSQLSAFPTNSSTKPPGVFSHFIVFDVTSVREFVIEGCTRQQLGISTADILYSFDCMNAVDDISQTYNGVAAALLKSDLDNATKQTLLPTYVSPDYSGQGAALKLNSSIPYQYLQLDHSPSFVNQTLTISAWFKPNLPALSVVCVLAQRYANASTFGVGMVDRRPRIRVYNTFLGRSIQLENFHWQYVTFSFLSTDLSLAIRVDGLLKAAGTITDLEYGNFSIKQTTIGSDGEFSQYDGLIDQLSIAYRIKNRFDVLDEATLVVKYNFEEDVTRNLSIFDDSSVNGIRATGSGVMRVVGARQTGQGSLVLNDSSLSYFQSSGFVLLVTHNFSYSYAFMLHVTNASVQIPLIHLTAKNETSSSSNNSSLCLAMLVVSKSNAVDNSMRLSLYTYGPVREGILSSNQSILSSTWYHVAVVSERNAISLYLNGTLVATLTNFESFRVGQDYRLTLTVGNPLRELISAETYSLMCHVDKTQISSNRTVISIDSLRFYSRRVKVEEIRALANDDYSPTSYFFGPNDNLL